MVPFLIIAAALLLRAALTETASGAGPEPPPAPLPKPEPEPEPKPAPKPEPADRELARLRRQNERLARRLVRATAAAPAAAITQPNGKDADQ